MTVLLADLVLGAQDLANLVTPGSVDDFVPPASWNRYANDAIGACFRKLVVAQPALFEAEFDVTVAINGSIDITQVPGFVALLGLTMFPDQPQAREVHRFAFQARDSQGRLAYRRVGNTIWLRPGRLAAAPYRMYYIARPQPLVPPPVQAVTVKAASAADLSIANPAAVWTATVDGNGMFMATGGGAGGELIVDGVLIGHAGLSGEMILIRNGAASIAPTYTVRLATTVSLPGNTVFSPGAFPAATNISRPSSDSGYTNLVLDGIEPIGDPVTGDLVLVAGQVDPIQNGLYRCVENDPGGWSLNRADMTAFSPPGPQDTGTYNTAYTGVSAIVQVTDGNTHQGQFRRISGVGVDVAPQTFAVGIIPGKGLWVCTGRIESSSLLGFGRITTPVDCSAGLMIPKGLVVEATQGLVNAGLFFSSNGTFDTIGTWDVDVSDVSFDEVSTTDVLSAPFLDFVEWIQTRMAIRALGKEENDAKEELKARLLELTAELFSFVAAQDSNEPDGAIDLDLDIDIRHRLFPWTDP